MKIELNEKAQKLYIPQIICIILLVWKIEVINNMSMKQRL